MVAYNVFTSDDRLDALDQLIEVLTSDYVASIDVITAGGTGYEVGEILDLDGSGTFTHAAQIEVTSVGGSGDVTGARIYRAGAYTADPDLTANATVSTNLLADGTSVASADGAGATFDLSMQTAEWTLLTRRREVDTVDSIANGGSGYSALDVLTLVGGVLTPGGAAATICVDTVSSGAVATVTILTRGDYEVFPTDPVLTTVAPSGGTGCTLNLTPRNLAGENLVVLQGNAGAAIDPLIGIKTYSSETDETGVNTVYNWAMFSMPAWSSAVNLYNQTNISPGFSSALNGDITTSTTGDGAFVPLKDNAGSPGFDMDIVVRHTGRSFLMEAQVQTATTVYESSCGGGLLNQLGVSTEFPFPAYVFGSSDRKRVWYGDSLSIFGGPSSVVERNNGPMFVWAPEGEWLNAKGQIVSGNQSTNRTAAGNDSPRVNVWPAGAANQHGDADELIWSSTVGFDNEDLTLSSGATQIHRTPDTGGDLFPLFPVTIEQSNFSTDHFRVFGQIDGLFWFSVPSTEVVGSRDRFNQSGQRYTVFQNGTLIQPYDFCALLEE